MYLDGCGGTGEGHKSTSSLIFNSWAWRLQQVVDAADKPSTLRRVSMTNLMDGKNPDTVFNLVWLHSGLSQNLSWASKSLDSPCKSAPQWPAARCHQKCELGQYTCWGNPELDPKGMRHNLSKISGIDFGDLWHKTAQIMVLQGETCYKPDQHESASWKHFSYSSHPFHWPENHGSVPERLGWDVQNSWNNQNGNKWAELIFMHYDNLNILQWWYL